MITRKQANDNPELRDEVEANNPFFNRPKITRSPSLPIQTDSKPSSGKVVKALFQRTNNDSGKTHNEPLAIELSKELEENIKMPPANQTVSLKDALKIIPEFSGENPAELSSFLEACDEALTMLDPESEKSLTQVIRGKLTGEARKAISGQTFETINEVKNVLKNIYFASKSVYQLLGELGNTFQKENEPVIKYANRIREIGRKILDTYKFEGTKTQAQIEAFRTHSQENVVEAFKRGLKPEIEQRLGEAASVDDLINNAYKAERELAARKALRGEPEKAIKSLESLDRCQLCKVEGHEAIECLKISNLNLDNHNDKNQNVSSMGVGTCNFCGMLGHLIPNCPYKIMCIFCQQPGHAAAFCPARMQEDNYQLYNRPGAFQNNSSRQVSSFQQNNPRQNICHFCNKEGHSAANCYLRKREGSRNETKHQETCQTCNLQGHTSDTCRIKDNPEKMAKFCTFCKARGHTDNQCWKKMRNQGNEQSSSTQSGQKNQSLGVRSMNLDRMPAMKLSEYLSLD